MPLGDKIASHPIVKPLSFLDWKWDHTTTPPSRMVLVQWQGFALEDTSWEDWNALRSAYDLKDEVTFGGKGIDSNSNQWNNRPKRDMRRPTYLEDYAWQNWLLLFKNLLEALVELLVELIMEFCYSNLVILLYLLLSLCIRMSALFVLCTLVSSYINQKDLWNKMRIILQKLALVE